LLKKKRKCFPWKKKKGGITGKKGCFAPGRSRKKARFSFYFDGGGGEGKKKGGREFCKEKKEGVIGFIALGGETGGIGVFGKGGTQKVFYCVWGEGGDPDLAAKETGGTFGKKRGIFLQKGGGKGRKKNVGPC